MVPELTHRPNIFSTLLFSSVVHGFFTTKPEKMKLWWNYDEIMDIHFEQLYNTEKRFRNNFVLKFSLVVMLTQIWKWLFSVSILFFCIQTWLLFPISNTVKAHELEPVRLNSLLVRPSQVTGGLHVFVWLVLHYYLFKDESFSGCRDVTQGNSNTVTLAKTIWKRYVWMPIVLKTAKKSCVFKGKWIRVDGAFASWICAIKMPIKISGRGKIRAQIRILHPGVIVKVTR